MLEQLNQVSKKNGWDDFGDVVYNSENRRTIMQMVEETIEALPPPEPNPIVVELQKKLDVVQEILSYDDRDEDEKIRQINELLNS